MNGDRIYFIKYKKMDGYTNMKVDEALFDEICIKRGASGFRLFGWEGKWVSYGRGQREPDVSIPSVRRPTGGGIVFHQNDISFSFFISASSLCSFNPLRVYFRVTGFMKELLKKMGYEVVYSTTCSNKVSDYCFDKALSHELVVGKTKVVGVALLRRKEGILVQGTIMLSLDVSEFEKVVKEKFIEKGFRVLDYDINTLRIQIFHRR